MFVDRLYSPRESGPSYPLDPIWLGLKRGLRRALRRKLRRPQDDALIQESWTRAFTALRRSPPVNVDKRLLAAWAMVVGERTAVDWQRREEFGRRQVREADSNEDDDGLGLLERTAISREPDPLEHVVALEALERRVAREQRRRSTR